MAEHDRRSTLLRSYENAAVIISGIEHGQLARPTPCPRYDVAGMIDHLEKNKVNVAKAGVRIGPALTINAKTERFEGSNKDLVGKANAMLFREYRKGFELKEIA